MTASRRGDNGEAATGDYDSKDKEIDKDKEQERLEQEMQKRRERIEKVSDATDPFTF